MTALRVGIGALACATIAGCGGNTQTQAVGTTTRTTPTISTATSAPVATTTPAKPKHKSKPKPKPRPKPDPGSLPQTHQLPSAGTPAFHAERAALWNGVRSGSVAAALPAFFPERAYVQIKAIGDPGGDWTNRLVGDYRLDLLAAHGLLGSHPASATLVAVNVPQSYAHWVPPGACYNTVGYYEVPNARVVYRQGGEVRSFGIASMISWRGVWYVVHLGAILRPSAAGVVDDPSTGPGASVPSSTC